MMSMLEKWEDMTARKAAVSLEEERKYVLRIKAGEGLRPPGRAPLCPDAELWLADVVSVMILRDEPLHHREIKKIAKAMFIELGLKDICGRPYTKDTCMDSWYKAWTHSWLTAVLLMVGTMTRERLVAATLVHCLLLIADATLDELTGQGDGNGRPAHSFSTAECSLARLPTSPGPSRAPITGWCKTMNLDTRVHKETCNHLPSFAPSPTCGALDLADSAAWMPTEPRTLWLWGDSVMVQLWDHLLCFLSNHVSPGSPEGPPGGDYPRKPVSAPTRPDFRRKLLRTSRHGAAAAERPRVAWGTRGVKGNLLAHPLEWSPELADLECMPFRPCVRFGNLRVCFGEKWQDSAWASNAGVSCFLNSRPDDVHVFNFGLWHNNPLGVPNAVGYMIRFLQDSARARKQAPPHLVWSESLPQHFKAPGGLYHDDTSKIKPGCMQTAHHEKLSNFRNKLTLPMLDNSSLLDVAPVHVFRGWRLLAGYPRSHNHKVDSKLDCTHWCQYDGSVLSAVVHILLSDISRAFWGRSWGSDAATK
eukprot:jgi/Tetstr1/438976/TSEL_027468.t1